MKRIGIVLAASFLTGLSPFTAEHPGVKKGNEALSSGNAEAALEEYDRAAAELGSRPEIEYNRGNALYRLNRLEEAREAYKKALAGPESLQTRDYFNMGNALTRLGSTDDAKKAYRQALTLDQKNEDARYNLEVLLRRQQQEQQKKEKEEEQKKKEGSQQSSEQEQKKSEEKSEDKKSNEDRQQDQKQSGEKQSSSESQNRGDQQKKSEGEEKKEAESAAGEKKQGGDAESGDGRKRPEVSRQEAERLLDAIRAREKNMPISPSKERKLRSSRVEKDW